MSSPGLTASTVSALSKGTKSREVRQGLLRWTIGFMATGLVLIVLAGLFKDPLLRRLLQANLQRETGLRAEIGSLHLGLSSVSLHITDLKLHNPPGFDDSYLLDMPEIFLQLRPATNDARVGFREIRLHLATLNVVRNTQGQFNLQALEEPAKKHRTRTKKKHKPDGFGGIDTISLTFGQINYVDLAKPKRNQHLELEINKATATNLTTEEELRTWLGSLLARLVFREVFHDPPPMRVFWNWLLGANPQNS